MKIDSSHALKSRLAGRVVKNNVYRLKVIEMFRKKKLIDNETAQDITSRHNQKG